MDDINSCFDAIIMLFPKVIKDITRKLQTNIPYDLDEKIIEKIWANQIHQHIKRVIHYD